jgi:Protein of unknown function (DUF3570)
MRKTCLTLIGIFILFALAFSQPADTASGNYHNRRLKLEETNLVSGYYQQEGNHSAITGGIGTQNLTDVSNVIQLRLVKWDAKDRKRLFDAEFGLDHHTSASMAWISKTGASNTGSTRIYPSLNWKTENESNGTTIGWGVSLSNEYHYKSLGANLNFAKTSPNRNRELSGRLQVYLDKVRMLLPSELQPAPTVVTVGGISSASRGGRSSGPSSYTVWNTTSGASGNIWFVGEPRNTVNASLTYSQIINKQLQISLTSEAVAQQGYLGLPFHRVYLNDGSVHVEKLPDTRLKIPVAARINFFAGDRFIFRGYYRFYTDSWGINAHSASLEIPVKIGTFLSIAPYHRFHVQSAARYFAPFETHTAKSTYYTSNFDLSAFTSGYTGVNIRLAPPAGLSDRLHLASMELRAGHYEQTTGLTGNAVTINLTFK